jgi:hypothetical protein
MPLQAVALGVHWQAALKHDIGALPGIQFGHAAIMRARPLKASHLVDELVHDQVDERIPSFHARLGGRRATIWQRSGRLQPICKVGGLCALLRGQDAPSRVQRPTHATTRSSPLFGEMRLRLMLQCK